MVANLILSWSHIYPNNRSVNLHVGHKWTCLGTEVRPKMGQFGDWNGCGIGGWNRSCDVCIWGLKWVDLQSSATWHLCRYLNRPQLGLTHPSLHRIHLRSLHVSRSRGLRPADAPAPEQTESETEEERKSRNEKKREAKRGVKWAMDLAAFSNLQIKRILRYFFYFTFL